MTELKLVSQHPGLKSLIKAQLATEEFLRRYEHDEFQETLELDEWTGESRILKRLQEKATRLREIEFAD
ncbi:MAG: hypothetical protein KME10_20050 [Plectolyngbya sp. WJT66-NPBG17]|nr:hypothetical protein [Plectolyngbya sp. WJT66-NPBG17]MBW4526871.1 hypothetical protein [Phormidium tanganyikae FI6-MK23]